MNYDKEHTTETSTRGTAVGEGVGQRVRGAAEVIHGVGEKIRGVAMGALDSTLQGHHGQANEDISARGTNEMSAGMERLRTGSTGAKTFHVEEHSIPSSTLPESSTTTSYPVEESSTARAKRPVPPPPPQHPRTTEG